LACSNHDGSAQAFSRNASVAIESARTEKIMSIYNRQEKRRRFEQFEQRLVMSAQALTSVAPQLEKLNIDISQQVEISQLNDTHGQTGVAQVHEQYGFDGAGQTVAIIDSGIAWDHYALGGAYGQGARVVGGWDFAENDANPYDDGPAGFHGTHVAGIVGSSDSTYEGVASGVDLVGLRVFDDYGQGSLEWVEQALQWVHDHKDDFENPITTVNLSIGTDWNANTVPDWGILENEFAQLRADGLFISVAAGNSFQDYGTTGLSYPAASPFVIPVASSGANGNLSDFSQRDSNVLVAPGEGIRSTVPDHLFGGTSSNRFLAASGTSMAAPYVAGASALLREANEFMGVEGIDQDMLYQQFIDAADQIYDSVTGGYYYRLNVAAAIDAVVTDLQSDSWQAATDAGTLVDGSHINGTIGKFNDIDTFAFTAATTGQITFNFETTHDLVAFVTVQNQDVQVNDNQVTFNVTAGQQYKFQVGSEAGLGHYQINVSQTAAPSVQAVDWGTTDSKMFAGQDVVGQQWYQLTAANDGLLSVKATANNVGQSFRLAIYDANMNELANQQTSSGLARLDVNASLGQTFYVKAIATNASVDFQVSNLISIRSGSLVVNGTSNDDFVNIASGSSLLIDVNGMSYQFNSNNIEHVTIVGNEGNDTITTDLGNGNSRVTMRVGEFHAASHQIDVVATGFENIHIDAGGGTDVLTMFDSAGNDVFENHANSVSLTGQGFNNSASGFDRVSVTASAGFDRVVFQGSEGQDRFVSRDGNHVLKNQDGIFIAHDFNHVVVDGRGGDDTATVYDTAGDDEFTVMPGYISVNTDQYNLSATGFERINSQSSNGGQDSIELFDSYGDDRFIQKGDRTVMRGTSYLNYAHGFTQITAISRSGQDVAQLFDSAGNDTFVSADGRTTMSNASKSTSTFGFERVNAIAAYGGNDRAELQGSSGVDFVFANANSVTLTNDQGHTSRAVGFNVIDVDTRLGDDVAYLRGSEAREVLTADDELVEFNTVLQEVRLLNTETSRFDGNGGADEVIFGNFEELDLLSAIGDKATAYLDRHRVIAEDFSMLIGTSAAGQTARHDFGAVDYLFMLQGDWQAQ
jgi:hypothetical protein